MRSAGKQRWCTQEIRGVPASPALLDGWLSSRPIFTISRPESRCSQREAPSLNLICGRLSFSPNLAFRAAPSIPLCLSHNTSTTLLHARIVVLSLFHRNVSGLDAYREVRGALVWSAVEPSNNRFTGRFQEAATECSLRTAATIRLRLPQVPLAYSHSPWTRILVLIFLPSEAALRCLRSRPVLRLLRTIITLVRIFLPSPHSNHPTADPPLLR